MKSGRVLAGVAMVAAVAVGCGGFLGGTKSGGGANCGPGTVDVNNVCDVSSSGGGANCGPGTVEVNGVCEVSSGSGSGGGSSGGATGSLDIVNGASASSASSHWTFDDAAIAFYADQTGAYVTPSILNGGAEAPAPTDLACPGLCLAPLTACASGASGCVDLSTDNDNCGSCGLACSSTTACNAGVCRPPSCSGSGCSVVDHVCSCPSGPTLGGNGSGPSAILGFTWTTVGPGSVLIAGPTTGLVVPFQNLTQIGGGVSSANFSAVSNGAKTYQFTLAAGAVCRSQ
ncbi:MAG: hypothetical protein ACYDCL_16995 [Myxococcales bacterium]